MNGLSHSPFRKLERFATGALEANVRFREWESRFGHFDVPLDDLLMTRAGALFDALIESGDLNRPLEPAVANAAAEAEMELPAEEPRQSEALARPMKTEPRATIDKPDLAATPSQATPFGPALTAGEARRRWENRIAGSPVVAQAWTRPLAPSRQDGRQFETAPMMQAQTQLVGPQRIEQVLRVLESGNGEALPVRREWRGSTALGFTNILPPPLVNWDTAPQLEVGSGGFPSRSGSPGGTEAVGSPSSSFPSPLPAAYDRRSFVEAGGTFNRAQDFSGPSAEPGLSSADPWQQSLHNPRSQTAATEERSASTGLRRLWELGREAVTPTPEAVSTTPTLPARRTETAESAPAPHSVTPEDMTDAIARILRREAERSGIELEDLGS